MMYPRITAFISLLGLPASLVYGMGDSTDMGPAALMWPPDRVWTSDYDNMAPCGSPAGVGNRTQFPLIGGRVSLVGQAESWNVQVSVSFMQDPKSNSDFNVLLPPTSIADLDPGHLCVNVPNPPAFAGAVDGTNATLQIQYTATFDVPTNQTFYACSDIVYISPARFSTFIPCFNATIGDGAGSTHTATPVPVSDGTSSSLSGGAIAGIVIGSVVAVALVGVGFFLFRRRQRTALRARQDQSLRGVRWEQQFANAPASKPGQAGSRASASSQGSIGLQSIPK